MYGRAYRGLIFVSACFNKMDVFVLRQDFLPPGAVVIGDDGCLFGSADECQVADVIGDDVEIDGTNDEVQVVGYGEVVGGQNEA